jgi:mono/diheme cytochrome c family protein
LLKGGALMDSVRPSSVGFACLAALALAGCDLGGGGGGGASSVPLPVRPLPKPALAPGATPPTAAERGAVVYREQGCTLCHGEAGQGGVANANSETGGKIVGLTLVKEGYTREQLEERLRGGVPEVGKADKSGPVPPLRMPPFGRYLSAQQIGDLADYVLSLYPKDREQKSDDWDEGDKK